MSLPKPFLELSAAVRPQILKLARQERLIDTAFREFRKAVYPGASDAQIAALRTSFIAGAAEVMALITYAADTSTNDATDDDMALMRGIHDELERYHDRTLRAAQADIGKPQ